MPNEQANRHDAKDKGRKRTHERLNDEEDAHEIHTCRQPCGPCNKATNSIEEKLKLILSPESINSKKMNPYKQACNMLTQNWEI